ncbi:MAG: hypothetical protein SGJ01_17610 [Gemmatimonadota bacterium]|nr:hypothetical protein [Gemmatimonadota bacterium]
MAKLLGMALGVAVVWGCSEALSPVRLFDGPIAKTIDPRCCPNDAGSGCFCPPTLVGSSNGTGDTAGVAIYLERNLICPARLLASGGAPLLNGEPWPDTVMVYIAVDSGGEGNHLLNRAVTLSVTGVDSLGGGSDAPYGHMHVGVNGVVKPIGSLSNATVNTGPNGLITLSYRASEVSGPITISAQSVGAIANKVDLAVGVPGLLPQIARPSDSLIGYTTIHPNNHSGIPIMLAKLDTLADDFLGQYGQRIQFNDMALPLGGKFDLDTVWSQFGHPHAEHRAGRDLDARTVVMTQAQINWTRLRWSLLGGSSILHTVQPHLHLRYRGLE